MIEPMITVTGSTVPKVRKPIARVGGLPVFSKKELKAAKAAQAKAAAPAKAAKAKARKLAKVSAK